MNRGARAGLAVVKTPTGCRSSPPGLPGRVPPHMRSLFDDSVQPSVTDYSALKARRKVVCGVNRLGSSYLPAHPCSGENSFHGITWCYAIADLKTTVSSGFDLLDQGSLGFAACPPVAIEEPILTEDSRRPARLPWLNGRYAARHPTDRFGSQVRVHASRKLPFACFIAATLAKRLYCGRTA